MSSVCRFVLFVLMSLWATSGLAQKFAWQAYVDSLEQKESFHLGIETMDSLLADKPEALEASYLYKRVGDFYYYLGEKTTALEHYLLSNIQHNKRELPDPAFLTGLNNYIGELYIQLGMPSKALEYYSKCLDLYHEHTDSVDLANTLAGMAGSHTYLGEYDEALSFYHQAFEINRLRNDSLAMSYDLNDIAFIHATIGDSDQSIKFYKESLQYIDSGRNPKSYAIKLNNMGMAYLEKGGIYLDSAQYLIQSSYNIFLGLNDPINASKRLLNLSVVYQRLGDLDRAEEVLWRAGNMAEVTGIARIAVLNTWAELAFYRKQYVKCLQLADSAIVIAGTFGALPNIQTSLRLKREVALKRNDFKAAFTYEQQYRQIKDSLASENNRKEFQKLALKHDLYKKEIEIDLQTARANLAEATLRSTSLELRLFIFLTLTIGISAIVIIVVLIQKFRLKQALLLKEVDELRWKINAMIEGDPKDVHITFEDLNGKLKTPLTEREFDILELALSELSNKEIAEKVFVSVNTVKYHLKNIYEKVGVSNRNEVLQFVIKSS